MDLSDLPISGMSINLYQWMSAERHAIEAHLVGFGSPRARVVVMRADSPVVISTQVIELARVGTLPKIAGQLAVDGEHFMIGVPGEGLGRLTYKLIAQHGPFYVAEMVSAPLVSEIEVPCAVCGSVRGPDGQLEHRDDCPTDPYGNA
jgi:hypothetical protein